MIIIDQFRISDDGRLMYIDLHVNQCDHFKDNYIEGITIVTDEQMKESCSAAVDDNYVYKKRVGGGEDKVKDVHLTLRPTDFNERYCKRDFSDNMFFLYVKAGGTPGPCTPCRLDEVYTIAVTFDFGTLYNMALGYMKELGNQCVIPMGFIDMIMKYHALKISVETDHWMPAVDYYQLLKGSYGGGVSTVKPCGCRG